LPNNHSINHSFDFVSHFETSHLQLAKPSILADQAQPPTLPQVSEPKILQAQVHEVSEVKKVAETLSNQVTLLLPHLGTDTNTSRQGHAHTNQQLPAPDKFDGNKWDTWKPYLEAKTKVDGGAIGGSEGQFMLPVGSGNLHVLQMELVRIVVEL
jgi:hypothetical protein